MKKFSLFSNLFNRKIGVRLFGYMTFIVVFIILVCCAFNAFALSKFYTHEKTEELISTLYRIETIYEQDLSNELKNLTFEKISNDTGIHIVITSESGEVAYSSLPKDAIRFETREPMQNPHPNHRPPDDLNSFPLSETSASGNNRIENSHRPIREVIKQIQRVEHTSVEEIPDEKPPFEIHTNIKSKLVEKTDKYEIRNNFNSRLNSFEIALVSTLENGYNVRLMLAMSPINEGSKYLNRFLIIVGAIAIILSLIPMLILIRSFTRPIRELSDVAKNVASLKFDKKYTGNQKDELGELGQSINLMSEKLETTILELKNDIIEKETLDRRRREFLSNVSHELKTPIALIEAYAEGLNENIAMSDEDRNYYCEVILDEANKMSNIIQKLMSLMRLEAGDDTVDFSDYNINEQISRIISEQTILFGDSECVNIDFEPCNDTIVTADEFLIDEVLTNYITNALKYRTENTVVKIYITSPDTNRIQVNIFNKANPLSETERLKIWDRFYMADKARTYVDGSRGLGLSIVAAIMKAHNQEYGVENSNNGVVFYFTLNKSTSSDNKNTLSII